MTSNQIKYEELKEQRRSNLVNENLKGEQNVISKQALEEEKRRNTLNYNASIYASGASYSSASAAHRQATVAQQNADTNALNAQTAQGNAITQKNAQQETVRHNVQQESLTKWQTIVNGVGNLLNSASRFILK